MSELATVTQSLERLSAAASSANAGKEFADLMQSAMDKTGSLSTYSDGVVDADPLWPVFKAALALSMPVRVRETALDCLQKLFARACLRGACIDNTSTTHQPSNSPTQTASNATTTANNSSPAAAAGWFSFRAPSIDSASPHIPSNTINSHNTNQSRFLIDDMMHSICTCFSLSTNAADAESSVQLQVLKVLLTAVTSATTCQVHSASLLKAVQTCFNVFLLSKNQANALTAKAALTQMVHTVFSRMERYSEIVAKNAHVFKLEDEQKRESSLESNVQITAATTTIDAPDPVVNSVAEASIDDPVEILAPIDGADIKQIDTEKLSELIPPVVGMLDDFNGSGIVSADEVTKESDSEHTPVEPHAPADPIADPAVSKTTPSKEPAPIVSLENRRPCFPNPYNPTVQYYDALLRRDAYLVFRLLCRLSAQTDTNTTATTFSVASVTASAAQPAIHDANPTTIKIRCLALEMLLSVLNNAGPVLQNEDMFASLVKTSLAASIGRNAVTTNPALFELSLSIFLMLIRYYRASMKTEVEVLLNTVYLHILEMGNSTYKQKSLVLQGLQKVMENSQTLVDLYLNYDCDMNSISLFERILTVCTRVAQGKERILAQPIPMTLMGLAGFDNRAEVGRLQEAKLRLRGLVCLVAIVESLVDWSYGPLASVKREPSASSLEKDALAASTSDENKNASDSLDSPSSTAIANPASVASPEAPSPAIKPASASTIVSPTVGPYTTDGPIAARLLQDALASTNNQPILVNKNRLHNVSLAAKPLPSAKEPSNTNGAVNGGGAHSHSASISASAVDGSTNGLSRAVSIRSDLGGLVEDSAAAAAAAAAEREHVALIAQRKSLLKQGMKLFEEKPVKGVAFFKKNGFIAKQIYPKLGLKKRQESNENPGQNGATAELTAKTPPIDENNAYSIACFLKSTNGLSKSGIGSYLGEGDAFCIRVMHLFVDLLDFEGLGFVSALRMFLQTFRLPGEAQKIDRLMEKFADRYCENNPDVFAKADTAYTLAFSVIMLNTDLHSEHIKNRMDLPAFLKNNRGINDNADLPDAFLAEIFNEIQNNEIIMEDEQSGKFAKMVSGWSGGGGATDLSDKDRMDLYHREAAQIQKKSQQLMNAARTAANGSGTATNSTSDELKTAYRIAASADLARPMFATACWPLIATFSQLFESASSNEVLNLEDDSSSNAATNGSMADLLESRKQELTVVDLCLDGFAGGIRIASFFKMEMEREAFVTSLTKLTGLSHFRDLKAKNGKAIKMMLGLTLNLMESLDSSWVHIIKVISQMERLQLLSSTTRGASLDAQRPSMTDEQTNRTIEKFLEEFSSQDTVVAVDRIFTFTTSLTGPAILQFFKAVCHVSLEEAEVDPISLVRVAAMQGNSPIAENGHSPVPTPQSVAGSFKASGGNSIVTLKSDSPPRMYLLQKIVDIAHYNMHRIRYEWSQIWKLLQPYFVVVGCHPNLRVSSLAVDALRQLSMKFLEREELGHFSTQNEFLKSFERIMRLTTDDSIRHMILGSLGQMIAARAGSIRSGWKPIFIVLSRPTLMTAVSNDFDELLLEAFQLVQIIFREYFSIVVHAGGLLEFINCVADFALIDPIRQTHDEIILSSIQLLQLSASQLFQMAEDESEHMKMRARENELVASMAVATDGSFQSAPFKLVVQTLTNTIMQFSKMASQPYMLPSGLISEEHFFLKWFPIFSAFSRVALGSTNMDFRTKCIESLFEVLNMCIHLFDLKCVRAIFRSAILPIFDDLKDQRYKLEEDRDVDGSGQQSDSVKESSGGIWILGLRLTVDLFSDNFSQIAMDHEIVANVLSIAHSMMKRRDNTLVATGQICMHQFIQRNVAKFGQLGCWPPVIDAIENAFRMTNPYELVNCDFSSMKVLPELPASMIMNVASLGSIQANAVGVLAEVVAEGTATAKAHGAFVSLESLDFNQTVIKCSVHIELLQSIRDALLRPVDGEYSTLAINTIPGADRERVLASLRDSYTVARSFNANYHLRYSIWKKRLVQQLPNLIKQETISIGSHIKVLFAIYRAEGDANETVVDRDPEAVARADRNVNMLVTETVDILERYVMMLGDAQVNATNIALWSPVVVLVFRELYAMDCWWKSGRQQAQYAFEEGAVSGAKCLVLKKQLPKLFRLGIRMMGVDRADVRQALQGFIERVGEELFFDMFSET
ncbi:guanine nucleotide exchange protein for ADP-robosylation factor [Chytriomyces hyalinus]|nr:guanine nucleotide exchange protein for ADP-robosylation factor [Chytriomyces hyalinus]